MLLPHLRALSLARALRRSLRAANREPSSSSCTHRIPQRRKLPLALLPAPRSRPRERPSTSAPASALAATPLAKPETCLQFRRESAFRLPPGLLECRPSGSVGFAFPASSPARPFRSLPPLLPVLRFHSGWRFRCQLPSVPAAAASRCCFPRLPLAAFTLPKGDNAGAHPNFASPRRAGMRT